MLRSSIWKEFLEYEDMKFEYMNSSILTNTTNILSECEGSLNMKILCLNLISNG